MISGLRQARDARGGDIDLGAIAGLIDRLVRKWQPSAIWLFGSRARGEAVAASDWDLLVIVPDGIADTDDSLAGWRMAKEARVRSDVILCGARDFEEYRSVPNTLAYEAAHNGILIYGL